MSSSNLSSGFMLVEVKCPFCKLGVPVKVIRATDIAKRATDPEFVYEPAIRVLIAHAKGAHNKTEKETELAVRAAAKNGKGQVQIYAE